MLIIFLKKKINKYRQRSIILFYLFINILKYYQFNKSFIPLIFISINY